jgi:lipopolysaccharide export system permease protein
MKLLDRYLFRQFIRNLLLVMTSLIGIYLLVDFFERVDNFQEAGKTVGMAVKYLILKIPLMYEQLAPVCIMLAAVTTLGLLNHNHELVALKAGGIGVSRIIRPLFTVGILFTILSIVNSQWVLPVTTSITNKIWYEEVKKKKPRGIERNGRVYYKGIDGVYSFIRHKPKEYHFSDFSYSSWTNKYDFKFQLTARDAKYQAGEWRFFQGQLKSLTSDNDYNIKIFKQLAFDLPEVPSDFFMPVYKIDELSLFSLYKKAYLNEYRSKDTRIEFHQRLSYLFLGLPLLLLGIPVLLVVNQKWGKDLSLAIPISCGIAFAAWGWWSTSLTLAKSDYLHPVFASWGMHFLVCCYGFWFVFRQDN